MALGLALAPPPAAAQQADTAIVVGTVLDESRRADPRRTGRGDAHRHRRRRPPVVTNERGQYRTPPLRIGGYDVSVELDGFKRFVQHAASC